MRKEAAETTVQRAVASSHRGAGTGCLHLHDVGFRGWHLSWI